MIKIVTAQEKTNSYRPISWHWSLEPFPAYRGESHSYRAFLACAKSYVPESFSKIIKTAKGTNLVVPCPEKEDEKILLVTALSGFRGRFSNIKAECENEIAERVYEGSEFIYIEQGNKHCVGTAHMVIRLCEKGYIWTETGRRCSSGDVEVFGWDFYYRMEKKEFEAWREQL